MKKLPSVLILGIGFSTLNAQANSPNYNEYLQAKKSFESNSKIVQQLPPELIESLSNLDSEDLARLQELLRQNKRSKEISDSSLFHELEKAGVVSVNQSASAGRTGAGCKSFGEK